VIGDGRELVVDGRVSVVAAPFSSERSGRPPMPRPLAALAA
jgi:hypothetical protein